LRFLAEGFAGIRDRQVQELEGFASAPTGVFGNESPFRQDFSDRPQKIAGHSTLKDKSIGSGEDRCIDEFLTLVSGKHNNPTLAVESPKTPNNLDTIQNRHLDVEEKDIGVEFQSRIDCAPAVTNDPNHVAVQLHNARYGARHHLAVVRNDDTGPREPLSLGHLGPSEIGGVSLKENDPGAGPPEMWAKL
jgi:hypothetical protein